MRLPKLLKVIFVILILITFGEIGYYLFMQFGASKNNNQESISVQNTPAMIVLPTINANPITKDPNQAINENIIRALRGLKKDVVSSATANIILSGEIIELETKSGITDLGFPYKGKLTIKGKGNSNTFYLSDNALKLLKVVAVNDSPLQLKDLNINDKIKIEETVDLTKEFGYNLVKFTITKL